MAIMVLWILDEKPAGTLTNPLNEAQIAGAADKGLDSVERVGRATAGSFVRRLGPFIDHREGETQFGGRLFGAALLKDFTQDFVGLHDLENAQLKAPWQEPSCQGNSSEESPRLSDRPSPAAWNGAPQPRSKSGWLAPRSAVRPMS